MPRVVPSQVVHLIKNYFPPNIGANALGRGDAGRLKAMMSLIDAIPDQLLLMNSEAYAGFVCGVGHIKHTLECWANDKDFQNNLVRIPGFQNGSAVGLILDALEECPDEATSASTAELSFIVDEALRTNIRTDIAAVDTALANGEWKAATVLAGSAIEALLLWSLGRRPAGDIDASATVLVKSGELKSKPNSTLERWDLHEYAEVAAHLGIIKDDTYTKTDLAREYRNLIHPGRAQRLGQQCDRGTALSCVAALVHVVRDLTP